jgi:hypothetical protein
MATSFVLLSSVTVGSGGQAAIEFTNISQSYEDLLVKSSARSSVSANGSNFNFQMSGITTGYFARNWIADFDANSATSGAETVSRVDGHRQYIGGANQLANLFTSTDFYFPNYTSNSHKIVYIDNAVHSNYGIAGGAAYILQNSVLLENTSAVTTLKFYEIGNNNFVQNSTFYLYGISNT